MPVAKKKEAEEIPTRADARVDALRRLISTLEAMPLNSIAKDFVTKEWTKTYDRFNSLKVKHPHKKEWLEVWSNMTADEMFKEFKVVEKHFRYLSIFSQEFYGTLNNRWNDLLSTFNPNASWYKD